MSKNAVIIVAGGHGSRFGSTVPKQFLELHGLPVLMHTINAFASAGIPNLQIVLVLPSDQWDFWASLVQRYGFSTAVSLAPGGATRFLSVRNGLAVVDPGTDGVIAVHDGVRPLVTRKLISRAFSEAAKFGSAIPAVEVTDTIRMLQPNGSSITVPRSSLRAVQTPQAFRAHDLRQAYCREPEPSFTDDASVMEAAGHTMHLIEGETTNIKITHPHDLSIASLLLNNL